MKSLLQRHTFLLVFILQGLLQFWHWTRVRGVCDERAQGFELLLHVNIFKLLLLGDSCHLFDFFFGRLQRLEGDEKKKKKKKNEISKSRQTTNKANQAKLNMADSLLWLTCWRSAILWLNASLSAAMSFWACSLKWWWSPDSRPARLSNAFLKKRRGKRPVCRPVHQYVLGYVEQHSRCRHKQLLFFRQLSLHGLQLHLQLNVLENRQWVHKNTICTKTQKQKTNQTKMYPHNSK